MGDRRWSWASSDLYVDPSHEMQAQTEPPLGEEAFLLGFSDQSHFCRTFKKQTSLSPLEYRRIFATSPNPVQES